MELEPPSQNLVTPLLELRDYCVKQLEEYENLYRRARSQLDHVEALLSNWTSKSNAVNNSATFEVLASAVQNIPELDLDLVEPIESEVDEVDNLEIDNQQQAPELDIELAAFTQEKPLYGQQTSLLWVEVTMLEQYQKLSRMEAIEQLLREHAGSALHVDTIVEALYGELEKDVFKVVKDRVQSSLTHGRKSKKWSTPIRNSQFAIRN